MKLDYIYGEPIARQKELSKPEAFPYYGAGYYDKKPSILTFQTRDKDGVIQYRYWNAPCLAKLPFNINHSVDHSLFVSKEESYPSAKQYWDFLFTDKRSPFAMYHDYITVHYDNEGRYSYFNFVYPDGKLTAHMMCFLIATRHPFEHTKRVDVFSKLVEEGVDPRVAFLSHFYLILSDNSLISANGIAHGMIGQLHLYNFESFFKQKISKDYKITDEDGIYGTESVFKGLSWFPNLFVDAKVKAYKGPFPLLYQYTHPIKQQRTISVKKAAESLNEHFNPQLKDL